MKKETKVIINFMTTLLLAVAAGIVAGKTVVNKNINISLIPAGYLQKLVYTAPYLMTVAVLALVVYMIKYRTSIKLAKSITVYVFTIIGIIISGFCGIYTMADFLPVAVSVCLGVVVVVVLVYMQIFVSYNSNKIHLSKISKNSAEYIVFVIYSVVTVLSAFVPIGPLPVIIVGVVWLIILSKI